MSLSDEIGFELLSVVVNNQEFAIDVMTVREIRGWTASTALPHSASFIKGMVNLRGVVIPIVSLSDLMGYVSAEPNKSSVVVVVETLGQTIGLLVDAVNDIITATNAALQDPPDLGSASSALVSSVMCIGQNIVSVISIADLICKGSPPPKSLVG